MFGQSWAYRIAFIWQAVVLKCQKSFTMRYKNNEDLIKTWQEAQLPYLPSVRSAACDIYSSTCRCELIVSEFRVQNSHSYCAVVLSVVLCSNETWKFWDISRNIQGYYVLISVLLRSNWWLAASFCLWYFSVWIFYMQVSTCFLCTVI